MLGIKIKGLNSFLALIFFFPALLWAQEKPILAPTPPSYGAQPSKYGLLPRPFDQSRIKPSGVRLLSPPPSAWDWRDHNGVTPVKDQDGYGACWAFASLGVAESQTFIKDSITDDYAEYNLIGCNQHGTTCSSGGNDYISAVYLTQKGTVYEACDPYLPGCSGPRTCNSCPKVINVLNWRVLANDINEIKDAVYNIGPVYTGIYANAAFEVLPAGAVYYWNGGQAINHAVVIVGWDDNKAHAGGQGAWLIKNSWGTSWSSSGYGWVAYGSARIGESSSVFSQQQNYNSNEHIYYYDEFGNDRGLYIGYGDSVAWGMIRVTPQENGVLDRVDFWALAVTNTSYRIRVYDDFNGSTLSNLLASQDGSGDKLGYYSIRLDNPPATATGNEIYIAIEFRTPGYNYPVPLDYTGPHETNKCYLSHYGTTWAAYDTYDIAIRGRTVPQTDSDLDGLPDWRETRGCTYPNDPDTDDDDLCDGNTSVWSGPVKICSKGEDLNVNGIVDTGETNPCNPDTEGDQMPDGWEVSHGLNALVNDASLDPDGDGISNLDEYLNSLDPQTPNWGTIRLSSNPSGADVYIDGTLAYRGRFEGASGNSVTPLVIGSLKNERHGVTIAADDYFIHELYVDVSLGHSYTVNIPLIYRQIEVLTGSSVVLAAGHTVSIASGYAAPHAVDFDRNGTVDLLVGQGNGQVMYYQNGSSAGLSLSAGSLLQAGVAALDVGERAKPFALDWNNDNKVDLLVGNSLGQVKYFQGSGTTAFFSGIVLLLDGHTLEVSGGNASPWAVDWDGDHKKDLVVGGGDGKVYLYLNAGTDASPAFSSGSSLTDGEGMEINLDSYASALVYDIDRECHFDLLLGRGDGEIGLCLYDDEGSGGLVCFASGLSTIADDVTELIDVGDNASLGAGDVNHDKQMDLFAGSASGNVYYYPSSHLAGDIDRSTKVDGGDWILLQQSLGLCQGDSGYNPGADLNGDNCVNSSDETLLLANFGETY